jgi:5-hydroxyisourate hydrolase-like protein (transthyretin family)
MHKVYDHSISVFGSASKLRLGTYRRWFDVGNYNAGNFMALINHAWLDQIVVRNALLKF